MIARFQRTLVDTAQRIFGAEHQFEAEYDEEADEVTLWAVVTVRAAATRRSELSMQGAKGLRDDLIEGDECAFEIIFRDWEREQAQNEQYADLRGLRTDADQMATLLAATNDLSAQMIRGEIFQPRAASNDDEVIANARAWLNALAPEEVTVRDAGPLTLRIDDGRRNLLWRLHDVARVARENPRWREEVGDLAEAILAR